MVSRASDITPEWLTGRLRANGHLPSGEARSVTLGDSFESTAAFWTPIHVEYAGADDTAPWHMLYKLYREDWYGGGVHETELYADFVARMHEPPVGVCYDYAVDDATKTCYLLLQDISKTHDAPGDDLTETDFHAATRSLARFHTHWWEHDWLRARRFDSAHGGPLRMANACSPKNIRANADHWRQTALPNFLAEHSAKVTPGGVETLELAVERWADVFTERIRDGESWTFTHGDAHTRNMFLPRDPATQSVLLVDWETYKRGIGAYDIAYMLLFFRDAGQRRELEKTVLPLYHELLVAGGVESYPYEAMERDYRLAIVACLFPPIAWSSYGGANLALAAFDDWDCGELLA